ncbi:cation:H+ antiporter [Methylohalomonas lacus]|uniref:Cation:H+ antiporter n=1 Tax=Methylohalomonas lacus TaxID=398773 RepID=A0AAE3HNV5_9GAMM|nr:calcium/sodium antiporter [Methylohalomonas lacus]MCS3904202.1 cation:H+ antiporter [Methylohalomonas lacus]
MLLACLAVIAGLVLLSYGADRFVLGAAATARNVGVTPFVIGLTVVGMATSLPEVLVGSVAALDGHIEIAIGNAIGSNIANVALVLGASAVVLPIVVTSNSVRREYGLMALAIGLAGLLLLDLDLTRADGLILIGALVAVMAAIIYIARRVAVSGDDDPLIAESDQEYRAEMAPLRAAVYLGIGLLLLLGGAELLVRGAVFIAAAFGISDLVIGLTIIAVGTSLPELAASIASIMKREADIAIGNIIGSNMFNMLAVLGVPALLNPDAFQVSVIARDFPVMVGLSVLMGLMLFTRQRGRIGRPEGLLLLACFIAYQAWLFIDPGTHV